MKKIIYIAGKVTDLPEDEVWKKFDRLETKLRSQGHMVRNPVKLVKAWNMHEQEWERIMRLCLVSMLECDEVHLLPCWQQSRGAMLERDTAIRLNIPVVYH